MFKVLKYVYFKGSIYKFMLNINHKNKKENTKKANNVL